MEPAQTPPSPALASTGASSSPSTPLHDVAANEVRPAHFEDGDARDASPRMYERDEEEPEEPEEQEEEVEAACPAVVGASSLYYATEPAADDHHNADAVEAAPTPAAASHSSSLAASQDASPSDKDDPLSADAEATDRVASHPSSGPVSLAAARSVDVSSPSVASSPPTVSPSSTATARRLTTPMEARHVAAAPPITMRLPTEAVHSGLLPTYKILVVGDAGVGKTNLLSRYCTERYDPQAPPTLGVEFFSRELDVPSGPVGQVDTVVVQLWDTAGQERSSMISTAFFRNAVGALLVYDVSRRETLLNIPRWAAHVRSVASEDCVCFVVGNKYDLCDELVGGGGVGGGGDTATVDVMEAEEIAHSLEMRLFLTSAKRGDGVLGAFTSMVLSVNAVQSVKRNHDVAMEETAASSSSHGKAGAAKGRRQPRRKSVLDLRGFGAGADGEAEGGASSCAC